MAVLKTVIEHLARVAQRSAKNKMVRSHSFNPLDCRPTNGWPLGRQKSGYCLWNGHIWRGRNAKGKCRASRRALAPGLPGIQKSSIIVIDNPRPGYADGGPHRECSDLV